VSPILKRVAHTLNIHPIAQTSDEVRREISENRGLLELQPIRTLLFTGTRHPYAADWYYYVFSKPKRMERSESCVCRAREIPEDPGFMVNGIGCVPGERPQVFIW